MVAFVSVYPRFSNIIVNLSIRTGHTIHRLPTKPTLPIAVTPYRYPCGIYTAIPTHGSVCVCLTSPRRLVARSSSRQTPIRWVSRGWIRRTVSSGMCRFPGGKMVKNVNSLIKIFSINELQVNIKVGLRSSFYNYATPVIILTSIWNNLT